MDGSGGSTAGLTVNWTAQQPSIPGDIGTTISVTSLLFHVQNLRVIGDAGPGDTRTSADTFQLSWAQGAMPPAVVFTDAPSGLYSRVIFLADGNLVDYSYVIAGTAKVDDVTKPFLIHDRSPLAISLDTSAMLEPGHGATLGMSIRLDGALQSVDFHQFSDESGTLELDTFDSAMTDFRDKMQNDVFTVNVAEGS
jgi:hypothetical protein